jgi:hypothetical protein
VKEERIKVRGFQHAGDANPHPDLSLAKGEVKDGVR